MARVLLRIGLVVVALGGGTAWAAAQTSRQAEDRRVDESARQTQPTRQTEAPKAEAPAAVLGRQAEPQRQPERPRQPEPQRQPGPSRRDDSTHRRDDSAHREDPGAAWKPVGPAWRPLEPAWRNDERPTVLRPGQDAFRARQDTYAPRDRDRDRDRDRGGRRNNDSRRNTVIRTETVYVPYPYPVYDVAPYYPPPANEPAPPGPSTVDDRPLGFLQLRVQPRTAEVFVDGMFAGTVDDFGGRSARMVTAGPRRVEIVAPGYETLTFDVRVPENDTVTFTRDLEPARAPAALESVAVPHKPLYVVPKCFIGDRPPQASDMPAGCRVEDVRVIP